MHSSIYLHYATAVFVVSLLTHLDCVVIFLQKCRLVSIRVGLYCRWRHRSAASPFVPLEFAIGT